MKWFKHDSNANQDAKLEKILYKFGADGYAIYWYCLELISGKIDKKNITFELEHDSELIGQKLKIDILRVEEIMRYMVELQLFEINEENNRIMCLKLATRLDDTTSKNPEIRNILAKAKEYGKIKSTRQYVYIFKDGEKFKIGKTNNIARRFQDAKTLNSNISLFHFIDTVDSYLLETKLHNYFNHKRINGEWFNLNNEDLKFICEIKNIEDVPIVNKNAPNGSEQNRLDQIRSEENRIEYKKKRKRFSPPSIDEIKEYVKTQDYKYVDPETFYNFYESIGWKVGKNKMVDWHRAVAGWNAREKAKSKQNDGIDVDAVLKRMKKERGK